MRLTVAALIVSAAPGFTVHASGQTPSGSAPTTVPSDQTASLPETIVTAGRIPTPADEFAGSVSLFGARDIEDHQDQTLADVLQRSPGIDVRESGGLGGQTSIFTRGTESSHTLILVDGVEVNDPVNPNGSPFLAHLTTDQIDRIEVLRGPQSPRYGSDAIGGVINVTTKKGEGAPSFSFAAEAGSFQTFREQARFSMGESPFSFSMSASRTDREGFSARTNNTERDAYRNTTVATRFGYQPFEKFGVDFALRYVDAARELDSAAPFDTDETESDQFLFSATPRLTLFDGAWKHTLQFSLHDVGRDTDGSFPSQNDGLVFNVDYQNDFELSDQNTLTLGAEFEHEDAIGRSTNGEFDANTQIWSVYLRDRFQLTDRLGGSAGVRLDDHEGFGSKVTWQTAAHYQVATTGTRLRASAGTGFNAPSLAQLFDNRSFGFIPPTNNQQLAPEESFGFDVGVEQQLGDEGWTAGITFFQNKIDNLITSVPPTFSLRNVESARTRGIEAIVETRFTENVAATLHYTYTDTEALGGGGPLNAGDRLRQRALHNGGLDVTWHSADDRAQATLAVNYAADGVGLEDHVLVDLSGSYEVTEHLELFGRGENLLDQDFNDPTGFVEFETANISGFGGLRVRF